MNKDIIVIVSGLPRSGTSMMMRMLFKGGLPVLIDKNRQSDQDNPEGYFEFEAVKGLYEGRIEWLDNAAGKAVKVIASLIPNLPETYQYKIIFMTREMKEILASQRRMLINRGEDPNKVDDEEMKNIFKKHLKEVFLVMDQSSNIDFLKMSYNKLLDNPQNEIVKVNDFLDQELNINRMLGIINPSLYRQRIK